MAQLPSFLKLRWYPSFMPKSTINKGRDVTREHDATWIRPQIPELHRSHKPPPRRAEKLVSMHSFTPPSSCSQSMNKTAKLPKTTALLEGNVAPGNINTITSLYFHFLSADGASRQSYPQLIQNRSFSNLAFFNLSSSCPLYDANLSRQSSIRR